MELILEFYEFLPSTQGETATIYAAVIGIFGVIFCFFGFRFIKVCFGVVGGTVGFFVFRSVAESFTHPSAAVLSGVVGGILLGFLLFKIYKLGVFATGAFLLGTIALGLTGGEDTVSYIISGVAAVAGGIVALLWIRPSLVISTSVLGAGLVSLAVSLIFTLSDVVLYVIIVIMAALGIIFQWKDTADEFKKSKKKSIKNTDSEAISQSEQDKLNSELYPYINKEVPEVKSDMQNEVQVEKTDISDENQTEEK